MTGKLTTAQKKYLLKAAEIQQWRPIWGIYFSLYVPGHTNIGRSLLKRGYIESCSAGIDWPYQLTESGWDVAWKSALKGVSP